MDITEFLQSFLPAELFPMLPAFLFALGFYLRGSEKISSHLIPRILCMAGAVVAMVTQVDANGFILSVNGLFLLFVQGLGSGAISAFIAIGAHQLISQSGITFGHRGYNALDTTNQTENANVSDPFINFKSDDGR